METESRQFLLNGDTIVLNKINMSTGQTLSNEGDEFTVLSRVGEGGSSVCYEARCESDGAHGRLKEFYPIDLPEEKAYFSVERGQNNQLTAALETDGTLKAFETARSDFKEAYCALAGAKNREFGAVLNNYIPPFELYEGLGQSGSGLKSIYVWTRHDKQVMPFDRYIEILRDDLKLNKNPEKHLFNVLNALLTLSKCIRALHTADLVHLDIKPSNFGIHTDEKGQVDSSSISLYDVNTIFSAGDSFTRTAGTFGFRAPEVEFGRGGTRSDIYSIGATLFYALTAADSFDGVYRDEYYGRIDTLVSNSKLITASDKNSNSGLHDILVKILKNCLAHHPDKRYKACSYLVDDLALARAFILPYEAREALTELGQEIKIVNIEEHLDSEIESGALGAIQRLLFERPLYTAVVDGVVRVLVLGAGTYAQKFIDTAFAAAQIKDLRLQITAVSQGKEADKQRYLNSRPAFERFFTVDSIPPEGTSLGEISFVSTSKGRRERSFSRDDDAVNQAIISDIRNSHDAFSYVFIALGEDGLNYRLAEECLKCDGLLAENCSVNFVWYGEKRDLAAGTPVFVNDVITESPEYGDLKRMAFNCHCLWNDSLNVDLKKLKAEFKNRYNFHSSLSNALSIKYKLHSVGIDDISDRCAAARAFCRFIEENREAEQQLSMYEHRRWLVCNICEGWDTLSDLSALTNDTRDRKKRLHPCIVESHAERRLQTAEWQADSHAKWDTATDAELMELDGLDRASVLMHRHFKNVAEKAIRLSQYKTDVEQIRYALHGHTEALKAFELFVDCLDGIANGKKRQVRLYDFYNAEFKAQVKKLPTSVAQSIKNNFEALEETFYPVLQSLKYTDYKQHDRKLVEGIPFILTYSDSIGLVQTLEHGEHGGVKENKWFDRIAPIIAVDPRSVILVAELEGQDDSDMLTDGLRYMVKAADARNLQTRFDVLLLNNGLFDETAELRFKLKQLSPRFGNIEFADSDDGEFLREYFAEKSRKDTLCALRKAKGGIFEKLLSAGVDKLLPTFEFDSYNGRFETDERCDHLKYIDRHQCLKPSDMPHVAASDSIGAGLGAELRLMGEISNTECWHYLCNSLKEHTENTDTVLEFPVSLGSVKADVFVPTALKEKVEKLLEDIKEAVPTAVDSYKITSHTASVVRLTICGNEGLINGLKNLSFKQYLLNDVPSLRVIADRNKVKAMGCSLAVEGFKLNFGDRSQKLSQQAFEVLEALAEDGRILGLQRDGDNVEFCFPSLKEKLLLTNPELNFALSLYRSVLESGRFDDCFGVFDTETYKSMLKYPFDMILIKDFRSLIVECCVEALDEAVYEKLLNTYRNIGINATPVMVCPRADANTDKALIEKYMALGVQTVFDDDGTKSSTALEKLERILSDKKKK